MDGEGLSIKALALISASRATRRSGDRSRFVIDRLPISDREKNNGVKGGKSRLLTYLIRLVGKSPSGIGYTIERAELTPKDNKYQLIDSFTL